MLSRLAVWAACVCRALLAGGRSHHRFTGALTPYPASNRRLACHSRAYAFSTCRRIYRPLTVRSATPWCEIVARIHPRGYPFLQASRSRPTRTNAILSGLVNSRHPSACPHRHPSERELNTPGPRRDRPAIPEKSGIVGRLCFVGRRCGLESSVCHKPACPGGPLHSCRRRILARVRSCEKLLLSLLPPARFCCCH